MLASIKKKGGILTHPFLLLPFLEKILFGASEAQLFPRPTVDLLLYLLDGMVSNRVKISAFWNILPDQLIGILYGSLLPGTIAVRKINGGS